MHEDSEMLYQHQSIPTPCTSTGERLTPLVTCETPFSVSTKQEEFPTFADCIQIFLALLLLGSGYFCIN